MQTATPSSRLSGKDILVGFLWFLALVLPFLFIYLQVPPASWYIQAQVSLMGGYFLKLTYILLFLTLGLPVYLYSKLVQDRPLPENDPAHNPFQKESC